MDEGSFSIKTSSTDDSLPKAYEKFLTQGETLLLKGDFLGLKFCDLAEKLQPESVDLLYRIGLALSEFGQSKYDRCLILLSCKKFRQVLKKLPTHLHAAQALGSNLFFLGKEFDEYHFYCEAKKVYEMLLLQSDLMSPEIYAEVLTDSCAILLEIGRHEQDQFEFQKGLELMEKALQLKAPHTADFWILYGHLAFELGDLINNQSLYIKSVEFYKKALLLSPKNGEGWFHLALSLKHLYLNSHDEDHYAKANECFSSAVSLIPNDYDFWIEWAHLLLESGRRSKDSKRLIAAIEKCQKAHQINRIEFIHQTIWAEALAAKALIDDSIDELYTAELKINRLLEKEEIPAEVYIASGIILNALGTYFDDIDFNFQAIEKFQEGLKVDRKNANLWFLIAETFSLTGYLTEDVKMVEKAFFFFNKALFFKQQPEYYFAFAKSYIKMGELSHQKTSLHLALYYFEQAFQRQTNVIYTKPEWLFEYALALDLLGDKTEEAPYYQKAIEILNHVLIVDPQFKDVHHRLAVIYSHLAELELEKDHYLKSLFHFQIANKNDPENDTLLLDMALTLTNYADSLDDEPKKMHLLKESEFKLFQSAKLGNIHAYYHIGGLYALTEDFPKAIQFLIKAKNLGSLPHINELIEDAWLENLKGYEPFENLISEIESSSNKKNL
jgi:tetratricopeptide (TPR) repeat protein